MLLLTVSSFSLSGEDKMLYVRLPGHHVRGRQQLHQPHYQKSGHHIRPQSPQNLVAVRERWDGEYSKHQNNWEGFFKQNDRVGIIHAFKDREHRVSAPLLCSHGNESPVMSRQEITAPPLHTHTAANHKQVRGRVLQVCRWEQVCARADVSPPEHAQIFKAGGGKYVMRQHVYIWATPCSPANNPPPLFSPQHTFCTYTSDALFPLSSGKLSETWVMEGAAASSADGPETAGSCRRTIAFCGIS